MDTSSDPHRMHCSLPLRPALLLAAALTPGFNPSHAEAQEPQPYTLHVYTNLMQFPTVVLSQDFKPLPPVPREKFDITLDGGPIFHPTKMRIEGDDPLSLFVLLDVSGTQSTLLQSFVRNFSKLIPDPLHRSDQIPPTGYLHPNDRISIYAMDCTLAHSILDEPAVDSARIQRAIDNVLETPNLHGKRNKPACGSHLALWDSITYLAKKLGELPGRRVILVVSLGQDTASKSPYSLVSPYISGKGIAVFGMRDNREYEQERPYLSGADVSEPTTNLASSSRRSEDLFSALCNNNGGAVLDNYGEAMQKNLARFIGILRNRYILEYPRPDDTKPITHVINVKIEGMNAFIRPTGGASPLPDPAVLADPNTLPSAPSPAKAGKHRPLIPTH
jgi:hypothetical protein